MLLLTKIEKTMENQWVTFYLEESVGNICLNRPPANAYEIDFMCQLNVAIDKANQTPDCKVVLIKSLSEKFFCAGADLKVFGANTPETNKDMVRFANSATEKISQSDKIFVAAINGHCLGGGLELALACDFRLARKGTYFLGLPEIKIGLIPGNGGIQRLLRVVGASQALEILINGDNLSPEEAFAIRLVNKLIAPEEWDTFIVGYMQKLASGPALAMAATKKAVRVGAELPINEALLLERELVNPLYQTHDAEEGVKAFSEKRKPIFKDILNRFWFAINI